MSSFMPEVKKSGFFSSPPELLKNQLHWHFLTRNFSLQKENLTMLSPFIF